MARALASVFLGCLSLLASAAAGAQPDSTSGQLYALGPDSRFETGCFGPCECPIVFRQLRGTFDLKHVGFDGLFDDYEISNVQWTFPQSTTSVAIRGSGKYRVGGEFAIEQEMSLDVSVGGGPVEHFDSGLVPGGGDFPKIVIDVSLHGRQACIDTVMHVQAAIDPPTAVGEGSSGTIARLERVAPNPFSGESEVYLTLARPGALDLMVYDAAGRVVRGLVHGAWLSAGSHRIPWDGLRDGGSGCAAGVYFVSAKLDGAHLSDRRIVKVK